MRRVVGGLLVAAAGIAAWTGCTEQIIAPGNCPDFCPNGQIVLHDTIFTTIIELDSAFRGYLQAYQSGTATAADLPGVQSRAIFVLRPMDTRVAPNPPDTTTVPIFVDSSRLSLTMLRRNQATTNLWLKLYAIPTTTDSTTSFASLDPAFAVAPIDSVNVSDLLSLPIITDTVNEGVWGDTLIRTDSAGHVLVTADSARILRLFFDLDTLQAPFVVADSGRLGFGIRVTADSLASAAFATTEAGAGELALTRFYHYTKPDTVSGTPDSVKYASLVRAPRLDSFVFDPPSAPLDSNLTVGGVPSARSLIRVNIPPFLHDSIDVVRATAVLVPVAPVPGAASDSFRVLARAVLADLGAKSPTAVDPSGIAVVHPGSTDTVRIDITSLVRGWTLVDTTAATAFFLSQFPEATSFTEIQFYSSRAPAFRPALHVTYIKRFPFGQP